MPEFSRQYSTLNKEKNHEKENFDNAICRRCPGGRRFHRQPLGVAEDHESAVVPSALRSLVSRAGCCYPER